MPDGGSIVLTAIHQYDPNLEDSSEDYGNTDEYEEMINVPERNQYNTANTADGEQNEIICIGFKKKVDQISSIEMSKGQKVIINDSMMDSRQSKWQNFRSTQSDHQHLINQKTMNPHNIEGRKSASGEFVVSSSTETENEIADIKAKIDSLYAKLTEIETKQNCNIKKFAHKEIAWKAEKSAVITTKMSAPEYLIQQASSENFAQLDAINKFKKAATVTPFISDQRRTCTAETSFVGRVPAQVPQQVGGHRTLLDSKADGKASFNNDSEWGLKSSQKRIIQPHRIDAPSLPSNAPTRGTVTVSHLTDVALRLRLAQHAKRRLNGQRDIHLTENNDQKRRKLSSNGLSDNSPSMGFLQNNTQIQNNLLINNPTPQIATRYQLPTGFIRPPLWTEEQIRFQNPVLPIPSSLGHFQREGPPPMNIYRHPQAPLPVNNQLMFQNTVPVIPPACNLNQQFVYNWTHKLPNNIIQMASNPSVNTLLQPPFINAKFPVNESTPMANR